MADRNVLVVDDDEGLLRSLQRALSRHVIAATVTTPAAARKAVAVQRFDAIVVDYALGDGSSGIELLRELKLAAPGARLLLMTGYASTQITVAAIRAGADDVRPKPVMPKALLRWIELGTWDTDPDDLETSATLERVQLEHVRRVVADCGGNISEAARRLGVQRLTIRRHLEKKMPRR